LNRLKGKEGRREGFACAAVLMKRGTSPRLTVVERYRRNDQKKEGGGEAKKKKGRRSISPPQSGISRGKTGGIQRGCAAGSARLGRRELESGLGRRGRGEKIHLSPSPSYEEKKGKEAAGRSLVAAGGEMGKK